MEDKFVQLQAKVEADNSLVERLFALENANEVQGLLKAEGLDFTLEEIETLRDGVIKYVEKGVGADGELSDEDLDDVAGGVLATAIIGAVCAIGSLVVGAAGLTIAAGEFTNNVTRGRW